MGDPLKQQAETLAALRQVVDGAGPYLDHLPERLVYDRAAEPLLGELGGPLPERGAGTNYGGRVALRPAVSNWRTTAADLDLLVDVARELGGRTARAG